MYLGLPASAYEQPKRLVGWAKTHLAPGRARRVVIALDPRSPSHPLSFWNTNLSGWDTAQGEYRVYVGRSSRDVRLLGLLHVLKPANRPPSLDQRSVSE